jgi:serine/threonine protein kinase
MGTIPSALLANSSLPQLSELEIEKQVAALGKYKFERIIVRTQSSLVLLVRSTSEANEPLLSVQLFYRPPSTQGSPKSISIVSTQVNALHDFYFERCSAFSFVLKPLRLTETDRFIVQIRAFARFNLADLLRTRQLSDAERLGVASKLVAYFRLLHVANAFHGDFSPNKVLLGTCGQVFISDFAPVKPFSRKQDQLPVDFYSYWFDEGLSGGVDGHVSGHGCYLAPERLRHSPSFSDLKAADCFSLGCVLAECLSSSGRSFLRFSDMLCLSQGSEEEHKGLLGMRLDDLQITDTLHRTAVMGLCEQRPEKRRIPLELSAMEASGSSELLMQLVTAKRHTRLDLARQLLLNAHTLSSKQARLCLGLLLREEDCVMRRFLAELIRHYARDQMDFQQANEFLTLLGQSCGAGDCEIFPLNTKDSALLDPKSMVANGSGLAIAKAFEQLNKAVQLYRSRKADDKEFELLACSYFLELLRRPDFKDENLVSVSIDFLESFVAPLCESGRLPNSVIDEYIRANDKAVSKSKSLVLAPLSERRTLFALDLVKYDISLVVDKAAGGTTEEGAKMRWSSRLKQRVLSRRLFSGTEFIGASGSHRGDFIFTWSRKKVQIWDAEALRRGLEPVHELEFTGLAEVVGVGSRDDWVAIVFSDALVVVYRMDTSSIVRSGDLCLDGESLNGPVMLASVSKSMLLIACSKGLVLIDVKRAEAVCQANFIASIASLVTLHDNLAIMGLSCGFLVLIDCTLGELNVLQSWKFSADTLDPLCIEALDFYEGKLVACLRLNQSLYSVLISFDPQRPELEAFFRHLVIDPGSNQTMPAVRISKTSLPDVPEQSIMDTCGRRLCLYEDEFVLLTEGVLRLVDFRTLDAKNKSSVLFPDGYRPQLKLRSKDGHMSEIVETRSQSSLEATNPISCSVLFDAASGGPLLALIFRDQLIIFQ